MGDSNDKAFEVFTGRVLENFKSKEHGAVKLKKNATVLVLGVSADGDKYFGEVGKQRGWFPTMYVLKTGGAPIPKVTVDDMSISNSTAKSTTDSPNRSKRSSTTSPSADLIPMSQSDSTLRLHTRGNSGPESQQAKPMVPQLSDLKKGGLLRRGTGELVGGSVRGPSPSMSGGPAREVFTQSSTSVPLGGSNSVQNSTSPRTQQPPSPQQAKDMELRKKAFQQQGASGRMFLSMGPTVGGPTGGRMPGMGPTGDVADFVTNRKRSVDDLAERSEVRREIREKEKYEKKLEKEKKRDAKNARKHKKKAHKTKSVCFGVSLQDTMERQKELYPDLQYPMLLTSLCYSIERLDGHTIEGIFRISGTQAVLDELKYQLDKDNQIRLTDAHTAAGLLKLWLGLLPEPLVPSNLHDKFLASAATPEESVKLLSELPEINKKVISFLVQFLQEKIIPHEGVTRMSAENIAMVLSPSFFVSASDIGLGDVLRETGQGIRFVINLLTNMKFSTPLDFENERKKLDLLVGLRDPKVKDKVKVKMGLASPRKPEKKLEHSWGHIPTRKERDPRNTSAGEHGAGESKGDKEDKKKDKDSEKGDNQKDKPKEKEKEKDKDKESKEGEKEKEKEKDKSSSSSTNKEKAVVSDSKGDVGGEAKTKEVKDGGEKTSEKQDGENAFAYG